MASLIKFCSFSSNGQILYALQVFSTIPNPHTFIYNTIMKGYLLNHLLRKCIILYSMILEEYLVPNSFTFPSVIRACSIEGTRSF